MQKQEDKDKSIGTPCPDYPIAGECDLAQNHPYCHMLCPLNMTVRKNILEVGPIIDNIKKYACTNTGTDNNNQPS